MLGSPVASDAAHLTPPKTAAWKRQRKPQHGDSGCDGYDSSDELKAATPGRQGRRGGEQEKGCLLSHRGLEDECLECPEMI